MFDCTPVGLKSERSDFTELETPFFIRFNEGKKSPNRKRETVQSLCMCGGSLDNFYGLSYLFSFCFYINSSSFFIGGQHGMGGGLSSFDLRFLKRKS